MQLRFSSRLRRQQAGDTIVEVLIAIAIISLVLATSYALSNRNTATTQDTQEHGQALQIAQGQIELIRAKGNPGPNGCFDATAVASTTNCDVTPNGTGTQPKYHIAINKDSSSTYNVQITWPSLLPNGTDNTVTLYYRLPQ